MVVYKKKFPDGETFIISIKGNVPGMIEAGLKTIINNWLDKQGSTVYFEGRKKLNLNLEIRRYKLK